MDHDKLIWLLIFLWIKSGNFLAIDLLDANQLEPIEHNYCNDTELMTEAGLVKTPLGQFLGYSCSAEFYHCRWQSDGFRTYRKACKTGLVFDTLGTQNCNFDFNIKGCGLRSDGTLQCKAEEFSCPLSEACVGLAQRCDGTYDCILEEDEQNCPMCSSEEFPCIVSEQCIPSSGRCNGVKECNDGTDEMNCEECGAGYFYCLKSNQCIPIKQRCDGVPQCIHGDDELLCKVVNERFYICENRLDQVPIAQVCDGVENCPDGSDEKYCNQAIVAPHPNGVYPIANNAFMELMNQAVGTPQQFSSIPEEQSEDDEESEAETQQEDDELPEKPLLPIARFTLPPPPLTTTTRRPTTSTTKKPKQIHSTVAFEVQKKHPFMPPRSSNHSRSSVSVVAVTAPPINRGKSVESITITTAAPKTNNDEAEQVFQVTRKALANAAESIDELDQELIKKLGARFSNNGQFSPKDILSKLESLLAADNKAPSATGSIPQRTPNRFSQMKTVRVTGRPSARKWKPSLSNNPSHRTTPLPGQGDTHMPVQFRQSDDHRLTSTTSPPMKAATTLVSSGSGNIQGTIKFGKPVIRKHKTQTTEPPQLEPDEMSFTYEDHP